MPIFNMPIIWKKWAYINFKICPKKKPMVTSEMLINYKRIKWTPNRKASHLLPGGNFSSFEGKSWGEIGLLKGGET